MKVLMIAMALIGASTAWADAQQDIRAGLLDRTVVVRGYYVAPDLSFDSSGHLVSAAPQGFGPSDARIYISDVRFEPKRLTISGRRTFSVYDGKTKEFRVALLPEEVAIEVALPARQSIDEAVPPLLRHVFLTNSELQQTAACPPEERKEFEDLLTVVNEMEKHQRAKTQEKPFSAQALSDVPQICMPMGERAYTVRGGVLPPKPIKAPDPIYTEGARRARVEGIVVLYLIVDAEGRPTTVFVGRSLDHDLDRAAVEAVKRWTFAPATFRGTAIPVAINVKINFRLN